MDEVGLLDEGFFMFSEEIDLCRRVKAAGWKIAIVPMAKIVHLGGGSSRITPFRMIPDLYRSKVKYFCKHYGLVQTNVYRLAVLVSALLRLAALPFRERRKANRNGELQTWLRVIKALY